MLMLTTASCHFSGEGMGNENGFGNWMMKMRKMRMKRKRKSIFWNVQRNCSWT